MQQKPFIADPDQHILEPPDFWTSRVPARYKDLAPRVATHPLGGDVWTYDGNEIFWPIGLEGAAGRNYSEFAMFGPTYESIRPGCFDPRARLRDMDIDGIDAAAIFPTVGLKIRTPKAVQDPEYGMTLVRAYNDAIWEWCNQGDPRRLVPLGIVSGFGIEHAMTELQRLLKVGFKGINIHAYPSGADQPMPEDDLFWRLCEEAGVAVNIHVGLVHISFTPEAQAGKRGLPRVADAWSPEGGRKVLERNPLHWSGKSAQILKAVWELTMSGVFERFPGLRVLGVETGVGWLPFFNEQMDDHWKRHRFHANAPVWSMRPSEYVKRNLKATLQIDTAGIMMRHLIGVDNIMWSSDYPHLGMDWPNSRWVIDMQFGELPQEEREKMIGKTCGRLYGLVA